MVDVLDDLFVLLVTPGAVDVLEGRQFAPGDADRTDPLSPVVAGGAFAIPGVVTA